MNFKSSPATSIMCDDLVLSPILLGGGPGQQRESLRVMRDAKRMQIYEGTNQIQRLVVAREWLTH